ncbi:hypothetical protein [Nannocystis pusilla]|uniref:hypothetical protein n=1 Tax=Nannocystis pusilla TaxID=889268 RepID=UPI003BF2916E
MHRVQAPPWGFAAAGDTVNRIECDEDFVNPQSKPEQRLCWHTLGDPMDAGYRCGADKGLNGSMDFERVIFQAD